MSNISKIMISIIVTTYFACQNSNNKQSVNTSPVNAKIDSATLLIYKLYSECETSILENKYGKIDTLVRNISYLCLPVKINTPEIYGDTTLITIFFEPQKGYEIENPKCDFAYSVGFVGNDNQFDFVVFGDNYYSLDHLQLKKEKPDLESVFFEKVAICNCLSNQLVQILNNKK